MAQYHFHASILKRSEGHSVVASAAYRAGERLYDSRIGYAFDYRRRSGILYTEIMAPDNTPDWMLDRFQLWNGVEKAEERKDSQLARSIDISLMCELTFDQNLELLRDFVKKTWIDEGMLADIAIHAPGHDSDERNVHAHILLTMRVITADGFGNKQREWNDRKDFKQWRKAWADFANAALERGGFAERIDHRSLVEQGLDREPTIHVGPSGKQIEHRGKNSDRAQKNRDIEAANDNMADLKKELAGIEERLAELKRQLVAERIEQIQKTVRAADAVWEQAEQRQAPAPQAALPPLHPPGPPSYPGNSAPPGGGKAASMPDNLSEQQDLAAKQEVARQEQAQKDEQARQQQAAADQDKATTAAQQQETQRQAQAALDAAQQQETQRQTQATLDAAQHQEAQRQAQARQDEETRLQQLRDAESRRVDDIARQNAERLAAQSEDMRQAQQRLDALKAEQARLDAAYRAELEKIALEDRRKQESERQAKLEEKAKEGPINDAGARYGQALGQHYDIRSPYASLAKAAMAEYAAFRRDREALDQRIAKTADPHERQALDLRKRIEGAEYLALTSDRIAQQSWVITGRRDSQEAVKERLRATEYRIQAQDLRQQLRELREERAPDKDRERERSEPQPDPARMRGPGSRTPDKVDDLIRQQDEIAKAKELEREKAPDPDPGPEPASPRRSGTRAPDKYDELVRQQDEIAKAREREQEKDPDRQKQQERERELQRERDRDR
jgi:hypothetical protein